MAINIVGGAPNAIVAKTSATFAAAGINSTNTEIIYLVGNPLKSFVPGRAINGITAFENGKGYYMVAKINMDLESYVVPPLAASPQLATPGTFTATPAGSTQINLSWVASPNATAYVVDRATNSGFTTGVTLAIYNGSGTSYNNTGLSASTQYYYRIRATAVGYTDSSYGTANATTAAPGPTFLTWNLLETSVEGYNTAKGLRKKTGATAEWANSLAWSNETINPGESVIVKLDTIGYLSFGLNATRGTNTLTPITTISINLQYTTTIYYAQNGSGQTNTTQTWATGDLVRFSYVGSTVIAEKSVDNGDNWTNIHTFTGVTGTLYFGAVIFSNVANVSMSEIYK